MSFTASSLTALAATASPPEAHEQQLLDLDYSVLVQLGLFILLIAVLTQLLWKPYLRVRAERVSRVDGYRREAEQMEVNAASRLAQAEAALAEVRRIGSGERAMARAEARTREQTLIAEAQIDAQRVLANAQAKLEQTLAGERTKLATQTREIAARAARQILGREVAP